LIVAAGLLYGGAMGSSAGNGWQVLFSAVKVPLLLLATFGLCLPSYFVLNTLSGVRADWGRVVRALLTAPAVLTLVLASLAPLTLFWYASTANKPAAILFNGAMFAAATLAAQGRLRRLYRPLIAADPRHAPLLRLWLVLFALVGTQLAWVLRPFVGDPDLPTQFLRQDSWGNAYVVIFGLVWRLVAG
jgi:hypothetical protein